ncbi:hypothetical protein BGX23_002974 [Mortierella sp. AD031]|nr:hypothetical protein BGX23_002974 [Mortierella sp. AD031]
MVSAVKIRNTYNGLCLDAPDGVKGSSALKLSPCSAVKHGNWSFVQNANQVSIKSSEDTTGSGALWECNGTPAQTFIRDPNTRQETLSFMTPDKASELSVLPDDIAGSLATFAPVEAPSGNKCVRYEWIAYN